MKINGTIFSKPQQDQLKRGIGAELDKLATTKYIKHSYAAVTSVEIKEIINIIGKAKTGKNILLIWSSNIFQVTRALTNGAELISTNYVTGSVSYAEILIMKINQSAIEQMQITLKNSGVTISTRAIGGYFEIYEEV